MRQGRLGRRDGFTFTELLVIVICIGLLAAIAIPMFLGQRERAHDTAAKSLVRTAASVVESAHAGTRDYRTVTIAALRAIEPGIVFGDTQNDAADDEVAVSVSEDGYRISSRSPSGRTFTLEKDVTADPMVVRTCDRGCATW